MLAVKNIGKPYTGKPYVRFDEGGLAQACPLLYPKKNLSTNYVSQDKPYPF